MKNAGNGYFGHILKIDLSARSVEKKPVAEKDIEQFIGGRGLGMKLLWDALKKPGVDPLSPENPLLFMPGPFSGFPIPSASRTVVVTKSPSTSSLSSPHMKASTVSYSNVGGFFGPEIRFAGHDGIMITGKASSPVYLVIQDDQVEIREAGDFWGMGTDAFDRKFAEVLKDRFETCCIGPAGENLVAYAGIIHTAGRAAGRGVGCVMGAKNLKAIAVRGTKMPDAADIKRFWKGLEGTSSAFSGPIDQFLPRILRASGTAFAIEEISGKSGMAVKNYREATFADAARIGDKAAREQFWKRDFACYCCRLSCKKSGVVPDGSYAGIVHDGPEYETGTMFGANLMISDLPGVLKAIYMGDDTGMDIISAGNVMGFLMEAREKGIIDRSFTDNIDLVWGNTDAVLQMVDKIARREGIGDLAARGVKAVSAQIGEETRPFAIHVKGMELAAHNVHTRPEMRISYATSNRGACHLAGGNPHHQNFVAAADSLGVCLFATKNAKTLMPGMGMDMMAGLLSSITGMDWTEEKLILAGERIFNLEKLFNLREGFTRDDDTLPERFFTEPLTLGKKGAVVDRAEFEEALDGYYSERGWDTGNTEPEKATLERLGLAAI